MSKYLQVIGPLKGEDGKSAYQYAQDGGYTGTEAEFAEKLAAETPANGLTSDEKAKILSLFKNAAYTSDMSAVITQLETLWSGSSGDSGGESGGESETTYTVTNNLTNVTNSNATTSVVDGSGYNATLTVADGCDLVSLTITMGGVDITGDVYGEGYILISNVTGDIVITAVAEEPQYVDIATGISTNLVYMYSDAGDTSLTTKNYQTGAYSLNRTETDALIKVRLTNNTDSAISSSGVYIGSTNEQAILYPNGRITMHYAVSGSKGSIAAGASVDIEYTVRAGYWLYVCGYGSLDVSIIGALDVYEPTDVLETTSKSIDSFTVYSDDGATQVELRRYATAYVTTEAFDVDTLIRLTVVSGGGNSGNILYGCLESGTLTANVAAYYGAKAEVGGFATGAAISIDYMVKAGYYFAVMPCSGATIYIERV